jgi:tRNA threonylcarbamoyladenosine biosynthesis protein TsaE
VITLSGPLGAGKTTLVRGCSARSAMTAKCRARASPSSSPMRTLDPPVWHVDLYRIEDPSELDELGLEARSATACCWSNGPSMRGEGAWPERARLSLDFARRRRRTRA